MPSIKALAIAITCSGLSPIDLSPITELLESSRSKTGAKLISNPDAITSEAINQPKSVANGKFLSLSEFKNADSFCIVGKIV